MSCQCCRSTTVVKQDEPWGWFDAVVVIVLAGFRLFCFFFADASQRHVAGKLLPLLQCLIPRSALRFPLSDGRAVFHPTFFPPGGKLTSYIWRIHQLHLGVGGCAYLWRVAEVYLPNGWASGGGVQRVASIILGMV